MSERRRNPRPPPGNPSLQRDDARGSASGPAIQILRSTPTAQADCVTSGILVGLALHRHRPDRRRRFALRRWSVMLKLSKQPKKIVGSIWRKLSWKAKLLVPVAVLGALVYIVGEFVAGFLG